MPPQIELAYTALAGTVLPCCETLANGVAVVPPLEGLR
jgi:hypothetical protein